MNNGDLKGFENLIYLKLSNSIKYIENDVFNDTPCLNYENISDHPIIRRIKINKFIDNINIKDLNNFFKKVLHLIYQIMILKIIIKRIKILNMKKKRIMENGMEV